MQHEYYEGSESGIPGNEAEDRATHTYARTYIRRSVHEHERTSCNGYVQ